MDLRASTGGSQGLVVAFAADERVEVKAGEGFALLGTARDAHNEIDAEAADYYHAGWHIKSSGVTAVWSRWWALGKITIADGNCPTSQIKRGPVESSKYLMAMLVDSANTNDKPSIVDLGLEGLHSAAYAIQERAEGIVQTANHLGAGAFLPDVNILSAPKAADFGTPLWHAQQIGAGIGGAVPYFGVFAGAQKLSTLAGARFLSETAAVSLARSLDTIPGGFAVGAATGFVYDGLTSSVAADSRNFWGDRFTQAGIGSLTYGTASAGWLKSLGRWAAVRSPEMGAVLRNPFVNNTASGALAGIVNTEATSVVYNNEPAGAQDIMKGAYTYGLTGLTLGALTHFTSPRNMSKPQETVQTMRDGTTAERNAEGRAIQKEINRYGDDPAVVLESLIRKPGTQLLALGEAHYKNNPLRQTVSQILPRLTSSYDVIVAHEFTEPMQRHFDDYLKTGSFDQMATGGEAADPKVASRMRFIESELAVARQAGARLAAIDHPDKSSASPAERNEYQALSLKQLMDKNPDSKIIWIGGAFHAMDSATEGGALTKLRAALAAEGRSADSVVSIFGQLHNGVPYNTATITRAVDRNVMIPVRPEGPLANTPIWQLFGGHTLNEFDYLAIFPKRIESHSGQTADSLDSLANNYEVDNKLTQARIALYDAWQAADHENTPIGRVMVATNLARVERKLGNNEKGDYWANQALHYNKLDPEPEQEKLLKLLMEPKYGPTTKVEAVPINSEVDLDPRVDTTYSLNNEALLAVIQKWKPVRSPTPLLPRAYWIAPGDLGRRWPDGT
jgi:hypothetical protein